MAEGQDRAEIVNRRSMGGRAESMTRKGAGGREYQQEGQGARDDYEYVRRSLIGERSGKKSARNVRMNTTGTDYE